MHLPFMKDFQVFINSWKKSLGGNSNFEKISMQETVFLYNSLMPLSVASEYIINVESYWRRVFGSIELMCVMFVYCLRYHVVLFCFSFLVKKYIMLSRFEELRHSSIDFACPFWSINLFVFEPWLTNTKTS